jgi:hypothetical protein
MRADWHMDCYTIVNHFYATHMKNLNLLCSTDEFFSDDFIYPVTSLSAFMYSLDEFVISFRNNEQLVRYRTDDKHAFKEWLLRHGIRDVMADRPRIEMIANIERL